MELAAKKINRSPQRHFNKDISFRTPLLLGIYPVFMVEFDRMLLAPSNKKGGFYERNFKTAF